MTAIINYTGCKVFIYSQEAGQVLAHTTILEHDTQRVVITVSSSVPGLINNDHVNVLIIHPDGIFEYKGTVRKPEGPGEREIALFKGKQKESRDAVRYFANAPVRLQSVYILGKEIPYYPPLDALIVNLSTNGILLRTDTKTLNIDTVFKIMLPINHEIITLRAKVLRINGRNAPVTEYGCQLMSKE